MNYPDFFTQKTAAFREFLIGKKQGWERPAFSRRNLAILFVLAACLGAGGKLLAAQTVTIGFEDYRVSENPDRVDLNSLPLIPTASQAGTRGPQCEE